MALGRSKSKDNRKNISEALTGRVLSNLTKEKIRSYKHTEQAKLKISLSNPRTKSVQITDLLTNGTTVFTTMTLAAHLNTTTFTIGSYIKNKGRYIFTIIT